MTVDLFFKNNKKEDVSCYPVYHDYELPEKFATVTWTKL
jgi:hypothetical protein